MRQKIKNMFYVISIFISFSCKEDVKSKEVKHYKINEAKPIKVKGFEQSKNAYTLKIDTFYYENGKIEEILRTKNDKLNGLCLSNYPSGKLKSQKMFYNDTARGVFVQFYESGKIMKIFYLLNDTIDIWNRQYDEKGHIVKEEGIPLIRSTARESKNHDTFFLKAFICNYGSKTIKCEVSPDDKKYKTFDLKNTSEPYVSEVNLWKPIGQLKHFSTYFKIQIVDTYDNTITFRDTLSFEKKP